MTVAQLELIVAQQGARITDLEYQVKVLHEAFDSVKFCLELRGQAKPGKVDEKKCNICLKPVSQCKGHELCEECHGPDGRHSSSCSFNPGPCEECGGLNGGHKKYMGWDEDGDDAMVMCSLAR